MRTFAAGLSFLLSLGLCGCVERALVVETDPPGAEVWMDGDLAGLSPVRIPFSHYGTREVVVVKGGYAITREIRSLETPWYERFPLDFFSENLWPWTLTAERYFVYILKPQTVDPEEVLKRAEEMREKSQAPPPGK